MAVLCELPLLSQTNFALAFTGQEARAVVADFGANAPTTEITIEFWQRSESASDRGIVSVNSDVGSNNRIQIQAPAADGSIHWQFGDPSHGGELVYRPTAPVVGVWTHFAFVASQRSNTMRIYRNGELEAE